MARMNMKKAFNRKMLSKMALYKIGEPTFNEDNDVVEGTVKKSNIFGVIRAGNKFSQFDEGISLHLDEGGNRYSDYWSLYITNKYSISIEDKIGFHGSFYNILQKSDEDEFGFHSYLLEKSERWQP